MASVSVWKDTMMRCMDRKGEKELSGAREERCWRIVARDEGWKILGSERRVMSKVLDGGDGEDSGGREDKSIERGERERFWEREGEDPAEAGGEDVIFASGERLVRRESDGLAMVAVSGSLRCQAFRR
jgi:hypothetical protein